MRRARPAAGLLALVLTVVAPGAGGDPPATAQAGIRAALERWTAAFNARDAAGACALFAPDLIATYSGVPDRDHAAMCRQLTATLADATRSRRYAFELEEILPIGADHAVVRLTWTLSEPGPGGADVKVRERGVDVFRRHGDGTWKVTRSMAYEERSGR